MTKNRIINVLRAAITIFCAVGILWFFLPILGGGYNSGAAFCQLLCLLIAITVNFVGKLEKKQAKVFMNIWLIILGIGILWILFLTAKINLAQIEDDIPKNATVIVLGAKVLKTGPSLSLKTRLDVALDYLEDNPSSNCIVTGGKGADEPRPEAHVQRDYLMSHGISEDRIFIEDKSTNTKENLENAMKIARENHLVMDVIIATQGFHQFRAGELGKDAGFETYPAVAYTKPILYPAYYGRELLSLTKFYIQKLIPRTSRV